MLTYNFDTGRWFKNQVALLERRRDAGELNAAAFEEAMELLDRRLEEMESRLAGSFQIPESHRSGEG
jgi:hypothetical protein